MTYKEIAEVLNISAEGVRKIELRAISKIKARFLRDKKYRALILDIVDTLAQLDKSKVGGALYAYNDKTKKYKKG